MNEDKATMPELSDLRIPDLWYDVYARLFPGTVFTTAVCIQYFPSVDILSGKVAAALACVGYICGLATQPVAWLIVDLFEKKNRPRIDKVSRRLEQEWPREAAILRKMHGECTFFVQLAVFSVLFLALRFWNYVCTVDSPQFIVAAIFLAIWSLLAARFLERRRLDRANRRAELLDTTK